MDRFAGLPAFAEFQRVADPAAYAPLPDGWVIGLSDVVRSTEAIGAGRYKAVNMAGAAAIAAVMNALRTRHFPFSFGGDGCAFALPPEDAAQARRALGETAAWVRDDLGLTLRTALVPVATVREAGFDVRAALFRPSEHVAYAMFDGGGLAYAEREMKAGRFAVAPLGPGARPDLAGLSCRWLPIRAEDGTMVSIIARPVGGGDSAFREAVRGLLALLEGRSPARRADRLVMGLGQRGSTLEALASRGSRALWWWRVPVAAHRFFGWCVFELGLPLGLRLGRFNPRTYREVVSANADARKFGDGLFVTADCGLALAERVRAYLAAAAERGVLRFGMVTQDAALMTCLVPSFVDDGHFHFIDGAGGGYAAAAQAMDRADAVPPADGVAGGGSGPPGAGRAEAATTP